MKKQSRLTALLLALCMLMSTLPVSALADGILTLEDYLSAVKRVQQELSEPSIPVEEENAYTLTRTTATETIVRETVTGELSGEGESAFPLPLAGKLELSTAAAADAYQWQIDVGGVWANIVGDTAAAVTLTYAKVQNALSGGTARVRCAMTQDGQTVYSAVATVTVDETVKTQTVEGTEEISAVSYTSEAPRSLARTLNAGVGTYGAVPLNDDDTKTTYNVVINYAFEDGTIVADPYTASLAAGSDFSATVTFPTVQGYLPFLGEEQKDSLELNYTAIDKGYTYNVVYKPTNVDYTVIHYQQNLDNDNYTEVKRETKQGLTNRLVPEVAKTYDGFYALLYEKPVIAADGSTLVEVYYDRYYHLMNFDLDGGYGVEPIYARFGAPISVDTPTKPGYTFDGWDKTIPATMPNENTSYKASWKIGESGFTVVFWYENANDNGYSVAGTYKPADEKPGTQKSSGDYGNQSFTGRDDKHFTYNAAKAETVTVKGDGSTVLNVYYTRNTYTLTFKDGQKTLTCTETEHTHSDSCCKYGSWHWPHTKYCCKLGLSEHTHSNSCYKTSDLTITAKYQADIHENFPIKDGNDTIWWYVPDGCESFKHGTMLGSIDTMPGEHITFTKAGTQSGAVLYYYIETLNGETGTYTHGGKSFKLYKQITLDKYCRLTYSEEFHPIMGFTQWWSDPEFDKMEQGGVAYEGIYYGNYYIKDKNYLCYTRNSYNLKFYNYNAYVDGKGGSVQYEAPLGSYYFEPEYPANLEKNAYVFDGWYTTAGCYEGSKADLNTMTMPASDVILYAKWVPKTHKVEFYLDKDALEKGTKCRDDITVPHGSKATPTPEDPENGSYTFVGWFYMDNGVEKAFDFANMPVNKDLQVYGKWSSNVLKTYTVYYKIQGTDTEIADPTTGSGLAGVTKTFEAKGGTDLYADYQEGYFPVTKSHSLTLDINATEEKDTNVFTFWYVQKAAVPYTVKYLNKETGEPVATEKTDNYNRKAVVTETFVPVSGMMPDAYQKRLVVSAEEGAVNEIIFYYTKDTTHAYYKITHYTENLAKDAQGSTIWTEYASSQAVGDIGTTYTANSMTIPGFTYDENVDGTVKSGKLTADGLELKLYYTRNSYPYQVRYLEQGTGKQLADPKNGNGKYGQVVSEDAKDIANYDAVVPTSKTLDIRIEESQTEAKLNVITFYYKEKEATINYDVVGPDGCGTVTLPTETLKVLTGTAQGSTATAADGYRFVGWYTDAACTAQNLVSTNAEYVPTQPSHEADGQKVLDPWVAATYYAKFEYNLTTLTVTKEGLNQSTTEDCESAIFTVTDSSGKLVARFALQNNSNDNSSVTIDGLTVGEKYTVTEESGWTWRYESESGSKKSKTLSAKSDENTVKFSNTQKQFQWLGGDNYKTNVFGTATTPSGEQEDE